LPDQLVRGPVCGSADAKRDSTVPVRSTPEDFKNSLLSMISDPTNGEVKGCNPILIGFIDFEIALPPEEVTTAIY
jgi:hypothetical protein